MARADFYILNGNTAPSRFSCTVAGKAFNQGNSVYIVAANQDEAARLDDLLWTYQDISFLPHACVDVATPGTPIIIGWPGAQVPQTDVLINLADSVPDTIEGFNRVIEIVADETSRREQGRERYKIYRERGYEMFKHDISLEQGSA